MVTGTGEGRVPPPRRPIDRWIPILLATGVFVLHMLLSTRYGYFRDELYYIAASRHPALGYFDFPAGVAMVAWLVGHTVGYRLWALHVPPALAHAALILIAGGIAADAGAGTFGILLASLAVAVSPAYLGSGSILTMDVFDQLCWALAGWAALRALQQDRPRAWLWFGAAAAVGLFFKMTMLLFGGAVLAGLLLTEVGRRHLRTVWPWVGGCIAALGVLPYFVWEVVHGWPTLAFYAHYRAARASGGAGPAKFVLGQLLLSSWLSAPIWLAGLWYALVVSAGRRVRAVGIAYVFLLVLLAAFRAKIYFLAPMYTLLFGLGGPRLEAWSRRRAWPRVAYTAVVTLAAAAMAPLVMPLLPPASAAAYAAPLHVGAHSPTASTPLIQPLADRFGWPQQVATIARVYRGLPAAERTVACVVTGNYGEASAVNFFGPAEGLPPAISGHNQYYLWGPRGCTFQEVVSIGLPATFLTKLFTSVRPAATVHCEYCMPEENDLSVYVDRGPRQSPGTTWTLLRSVS